MHRTILLNATYQQGSISELGTGNADLFEGFERRRLSAEEMRDSLLVASGQLDRMPAESHPFPPESTWGYTQHIPFSTFFETDKRSVYLVQVRNRRHPFLGLFNGAGLIRTPPPRNVRPLPCRRRRSTS